jgi:hypothetical protein
MRWPAEVHWHFSVAIIWLQMRLRYAYIVYKSLQKHCQTVFSRFLATTRGNLWGVQHFPDFLKKASLVTVWQFDLFIQMWQHFGTWGLLPDGGIWDWNIPRITPNAIRILKTNFIGRGTPLALPPWWLRCCTPVTCVPSFFTTCTLLLIKLLRALYLVVKYYWNEARPGCAILWMSSTKDMKNLCLLLLANYLLLKKLLRRLLFIHLTLCHGEAYYAMRG